MTVKILFSALPETWDSYRAHLATALDRAGIAAEVTTDTTAHDVDYIVFEPKGPVTDFSTYPRCKAVLSLWAGVEKIVGNATLTQPLTRMVDSGLSHGMVEYVAGHVLRYHLGIDRYISAAAGTWEDTPPPLARDRVVTIMGLGALGTAVGEALVALGFQVRGWSRRQKDHPTIRCYSGSDGLRDALRDADGVVTLLPLTAATENILGAREMDLLQNGAFVINPGRGPLIDDDALLAALGSGRIGHATLDVFRTEPLPADHPFWAHDRITVTPHIASATRCDTASEVIAENIRRSESNLPLLHLVDRAAGY